MEFDWIDKLPKQEEPINTLIQECAVIEEQIGLDELEEWASTYKEIGLKIIKKLIKYEKIVDVT